MGGNTRSNGFSHFRSCPYATDRYFNPRRQARGKARRLYGAGGLYAEFSPTGGKWFRLKYRFNGKEKRISLGVYSDVSFKDARDRRDAARKLLPSGIDPSQDRKQQKSLEANQAASSFEAVSRESFEENPGASVAAHAERKPRLFERDIFPALGKRPLPKSNRPICLPCCNALKQGEHTKRQSVRTSLAGKSSAMPSPLTG